MDNWKRDFDSWCFRTYVTEKSTHSAVTSDFANRALCYLRTPERERDAFLIEHTDLSESQRSKFKFKVIILLF